MDCVLISSPLRTGVEFYLVNWKYRGKQTIVRALRQDQTLFFTSQNGNAHVSTTVTGDVPTHLSLESTTIFLLPKSHLHPNLPEPSSINSLTPPTHLPNNQSPKMSQAAAQKRLLVEYKNLTNDPPDGITAGPSNEDDMFVWEALIQGPEGTPFEGGIFPAELKFPRDYPLSPPSMRFTCELWHPNGECRLFLLREGEGD